jgi:ribosomal protein S18 acetylase RimI-like enzyme
MSDAITVRPATRADVAAAGRLGAQLVRQHAGFDPQRFMTPAVDVDRGYAWFLGTQLLNAHAVVLVAERDHEVVGYLYGAVEPMSWEELRDEAGFIHDIVVDERARRGGVATRLVDAALAWFASQGMPRVLLWTATGNETAQRLFTRLGFRKTMIEMTKELSQ